MAAALADGATTSVALTQAHLDRIAAVDGAVHAFLHVDAEGALAQAAASDERRAAGAPARTPRRRTDRGQGRPGHRGPADHVRVEDPRGLDPAVRRHGRRAPARRPACRSSARPTWTSSRWAPPPSTPPTARPTTRGTSTGSPAAPAAARPPRSPPSRRRSRSAPTPAARSASPAPSPAPSASSRPTAASRATAWSRMANSLDQVGPVTRTVLDAALLHEVIGGHDPRDSTSVDQPLPDLVGAARQGAERRPDRRTRRRHQGARRARATRTACWRASRSRSTCWSRPGAEVVEVSCPTFVHALATYYLIMPCEASSNLAKFDAMRYGLRVLPEGVDSPVAPRTSCAPRRDAGFGDEVKRRIILGTYALSQRLLRRLLRPGPEGPHADHARLRRRVRAGRRAALADRADHGVQAGREARRPAGDVPQRPRHHPGQPGRRARHLAAQRPGRRGRPAGRHPGARPGARRRPRSTASARRSRPPCTEQWGGPLLDQAPALEGAL